MRKDIIIDVNNGDAILSSIKSSIYPVVKTGIESGMSDNKMYYDIYIPNNDFDTINFKIPYTPSIKTSMVRIHSKNGVIKNSFDGGNWFDVFFDNRPIALCEFGLISKTFEFTGFINQETGVLDIYDANSADFSVGRSIYQDAYLIMKLAKTNYLKEPVLGVGVINSINDTTEDGLLARRVQSELDTDNIKTTSIDILPDGMVSLGIEENGIYGD